MVKLPKPVFTIRYFLLQNRPGLLSKIHKNFADTKPTNFLASDMNTYTFMPDINPAYLGGGGSGLRNPRSFKIVIPKIQATDVGSVPRQILTRAPDFFDGL